MFFIFIVSLIVTSVLAIRHKLHQAGPSVTVKNGTIIGSTASGIDSFLGIPFALPPTGPLRLNPPHYFNTTYTNRTFVATGVPTACPQFQDATNTAGLAAEALVLLAEDAKALGVTGPSGEDCLTLNVQRPAGTTSTSALPVVFWFFWWRYHECLHTRYRS